MLGRILCLLNRHRPRSNSTFRGEKGVKMGECRRCRRTIRLSNSGAWLLKRTPLTEGDLDARAAALAKPVKERRRHRST